MIKIKLIGGPLDGGSIDVETLDSSFAIYFDGPRLARYDKKDNEHYSFVMTFYQSELERVA